jgi:hypothetical protein
MKKLNIIIILFISFPSFAQIPVNNFTPKEKLYLQTLQQAVAYLKSKPTKYFDFHQTETYSNDEAFYDTVISKFFNKEKMLRNFEKNIDVFAVEGKMDIVRHILNGCDYYLDFVPTDSIYLTAQRNIIKGLTFAEDSLTLSNSLEISFKVDGKWIRVLGVTFDEETNKLFGLSIIGTGDSEEVKKLLNFIRRQKNYYEYPVKRNFD